MPPRKAPASPSSAPMTTAPGVPLATKVAGAPATPASSTPAVAPAAKKKDSSPHSAREKFGDLYFQPTRESGESEEDYRKRLKNINERVVSSSLKPKRSPGSFTLLTENNKEGYTGETRFRGEIQTLEREINNLRHEISRFEALIKSDPDDKDLYIELIKRKEGKIADATTDIQTLLRAGGEHYATAQQDETFANSPRRMHGKALTLAIESSQHLKTREEVQRIGTEVRQRNTRELQELKGVVVEQAAEIQELKDRVGDLMYGMKTLAAGKIPDHIQDALVHTELTLKALKNARDTGESFDPSENGDLDKMLEAIDDLLNENLLGKTVEEEIKQELKTTKEALEELAKEEKDITVDTLKEKGIEEKTAEATIDLLKKQGIIT